MALKGDSSRKSKTALGVLMLTSVGGTEEDPGVRVDDPVGPKLLRWRDGMFAVGRMPRCHPLFRRAVERSDPGAYGFMIARLKYMDDVIREKLGEGVRQFVVLGAGYDTRAYRMRGALSAARVFEVDLPAMSQDKQARLVRALGGLPSYVEFVDVDFNEETFSDRLVERGLDVSLPTLFLLSGVSMYLPREAVLELLSQIAGRFDAGSSLLFDYFFAGVIESPESYLGGSQWVARARRAGEEPRFGLEMDDAGSLLDSCGLRLETQCDMAELAERYLKRSDGTKVPDPYDFAAVAYAVVKE
jgi:methyltransferase (TIGR00027 family)